MNNEDKHKLKMQKLKENIDSVDITLEESILNEINLIHEKIPNPAP